MRQAKPTIHWKEPPVKEAPVEIVWNDRAAAPPAPFARALPKFAKVQELDELEALRPWLVVGKMWIVKMHLRTSSQPAQPFPYLDRAYATNDAHLSKNSIAIYSGLVHIDERTSRGKEIRVWRHTFILGNARYIIVNIKRLMTPVK